ncbi:cytochrome ubiquinol oxidase subunit I [Actinobacteria bacterium YIM 96077]|uniref:Cytochrome ubiquinol oxidase subunit I n=1 Tax=Phytoactinopolyspora halophila TaxID=1981511 RepID=A0A329R6T1_9ACTN|nr:cytochrome ubiquinol oxidase subunit I [Phytoactinopolyspora halophila]AYY12008.1 cytochrome ubiquinol oxidase subunit I [Actinobacteria bacterium YIM 96077]RAW18758.1 cytochrome ubiquinol oxidase subunit I [Phytoactinopolyspora halophila]
MAAVDVARLQFALTATLHFLFVVITLGLTPLIAIMQTRWAITGKAVHEQMTRFWGQLYVINYAIGIVSGLVMEFQFGLHWTGLMEFAGDVFGAPLAIETLVAFFLESTFLGMWIFGWHRLNRWVHTVLFWLVTLTAYLSAYWVMVANGFLQEPAGHVVEDGVARIDDIGALLSNEQAIGALLHIAPASILTGCVLILGVSAWHFLRGTPDVDFFRRSVRLAVVAGVVAVWSTVIMGFAQFAYMTEGKLLAFGASAAERADVQAEMEAVHGPGNWTPPEWVSFVWPVMEWIGHLYSFLFIGLLVLLIKNAFDRARPAWFRRAWHRFYVWTIPLPVIAVICGWLLREVGRQPWMVYGELRVDDAVAPHGVTRMTISLVLFGGAVAALAAIDWWVIARLARRGPRHVVLGSDLGGHDLDVPGVAFAGERRSDSAASQHVPGSNEARTAQPLSNIERT